VPVNRPVIKAAVNGKRQWLGIRLTTAINRSKLQRIVRSPVDFLDFIDRFETTNILMAAEHLNQYGPLSTTGHAFVIRLNVQEAHWQFINPGKSLYFEDEEDWKQIKELLVDVLQVRFYEVIGTGTKHLEQASEILNPQDAAPKLLGKRAREEES
jgi:hypothetical protein